MRFAPAIEGPLHPKDPRARPDADRWRHKRMARRIARRLHGEGAVALIHPDQVVWYETEGAAAIEERDLLAAGGGLVRGIASSRVHRDGLDALRAAVHAKILGVPLVDGSRAHAAAPSVAAVRGAFARLCPDGAIYAADDAVPPFFRTVSTRERRAIFFEAVHFARHLRRSTRRCRFDVTSFCADGALRLVFVVDRSHDRRRRLAWRRFVRRATIAAAVASAPQNERSLAAAAGKERVARAARSD